MNYIHDCEDCIHLGEFEGMDLYIHYRDTVSEVVARFGNNGSEYYASDILFTQKAYVAEALSRV